MGDETQRVHTLGDLLTQLSFWEAVQDMKRDPGEDISLKLCDAALQSVQLMTDIDLQLGIRPNAEALESPTKLKEQFLQSIERLQNLIFACAPYLSCAEDNLTNEHGDNPFMRHGINFFLAVLSGYFQLFEVQRIPDALDEAEQARFLGFLHRFLAHPEFDRVEVSDSVRNRDAVGRMLDTMMKSGELDGLVGEDAKNLAIRRSERTLSPVTRSPKAYMPVSKVARKQLMAVNEALSVDVGGDAHVETQIWIEQGVTLDEFDIEIQNTIGEMIQNNGDRVLTATPAQIFRECAALMDKEKVSLEMEAQVERAVDKMLLSRAMIDYTAQIQRHKRIKRQKDFDYDAMRIEGHLIEGRKLTVNAGGYVKVAYRFYDKPMYYAYSHAIGQIAAVNKKLLNTSASGDSAKTRKNTRDFVLLKRALAREIERMKKEASRAKGVYEQRLSYARIQEEIGLREPSDKQARTLRNDVDYLCRLWVSLGHIQSFEKYKNDRAFAGVRIEL